MSGESASAPAELGSGIRVPAHALHELDEPISEQWVSQTLDDLREDIADYLDTGEEIEAVYTGFGTSFGKAGSGLYVFAATDRRFMVLDQTGAFDEVDYTAVESIDRDAGAHSFEIDTSKWREIGASATALVVFAVLANVTQQSIFALGLVASLFAAAYFGNRHRKQTKKLHVPYEDVVFRTPTSTETSHTVTAEADHWLGTLDVDVQTEHSERYVLRQWKIPENLADHGPIEFAGPEAYARDGASTEPGELEVKLTEILRRNR